VSSPALANSCPSVENATWLMKLVEWERSVCSSRPLVTSHSRTLPSLEQLARRMPSGLNATLNTADVWPRSSWSVDCPHTSHKRIVVSYAPDAIVLPSGLQAMQASPLVWPSYRATGTRPLTSHTNIKASCAPDASSVPSGENATARTSIECSDSMAACMPVTVSHSITRLSQASAARVASGDNDTL